MPSSFCAELFVHTYSDKADMSAMNIALCVINGIFSLIAIVSNSFVVFALWKTISLHSPSFVLLCSLAVSDLSVGLVSQPLYIAFHLLNVSQDYTAACAIGATYFSLGIGLAVFSFFLITLISVDRFLAVHLLVKYRHRVTVRRVGFVVLFSAVASFLVGSTYIINKTLWYTMAPVIMVVFFSISTFAFSRSVWMLRHRQAQMIQCLEEQPQASIARYKKTTTSMLMLYLAFMLCYLPYGFYVVVVLVGQPNMIAHDITSTLIYLNSSVNPCLYFWRIREIRQSLNQICQCFETDQTQVAANVDDVQQQTLSRRI